MAKNITIAWIFLFIASASVPAQIYFTKNGHISFYSKTILENISADNNQVISVFNIQTGELKFSLLNRTFIFPKAKMEEDFNHDYMESSRYPRSQFSGSISQIANIDFTKDGIWDVTVSGDLQIHGVTKKISVPGKISVKGGKISATSSFKIFLKDYNIKIPAIVSNKIAESVKVTVNCLYQKK